MRRPGLFLLLIFFCTAFLKWSPPRVVIFVEPQVRDNFQEMIRRNPLPDSLRYVYVDYSAGDATLSLVISKPDDVQTNDLGAGDPGNVENKTETIFSARVKKAWEEYPRDQRIIPLDEIRLPDIACPVDCTDAFLAVAAERKAVLSIRIDAPESLLSWFEQASHELENPIVWIAAVGDIMLERGIQEILLNRTDGVASVFDDTLPFLKNADILLGNLEGTVSDADNPVPKSFNFRFKPDSPAALAEAGFDYLMLSNNHTFDYGPKGFSDTCANLRRHRLAFSGAGENLAEARKPFSAIIRGTLINIISFGAFPSEIPTDLLETRETRPGILREKEGLAAVKSMATDDSFDIVMVHAGVEYSNTPDASTRELFHAVIDAGADCVLGSHPHVLQGIEVYKGKLIAYSLGNFIFPGMGRFPNAVDSMILFLGVHDGVIVAIVPVFVRLTDAGVRLTEAATDRFFALSGDMAFSGRQ